MKSIHKLAIYFDLLKIYFIFLIKVDSIDFHQKVANNSALMRIYAVGFTNMIDNQDILIHPDEVIFWK